MIETMPKDSSEPESYDLTIALQGAALAVPTLLGRNNYTVTRTGVGAMTLTFSDDPGPTFLGNGGGGFTDVTPANAAGWTVVCGAYTAQSGGGTTKATLKFVIYNSSFAAADIAATTKLCIDLQFKKAPATL